MGDATGISWTDSTWNPWMGCTKVSPGCAHCYMFREQRQYGNDPDVVRRSKTKFKEPLKWDDPRLVFTCSWSDWFHEAADAWREEAWEIVRACPQHTFQILTKRPELIPDRLPDDWGDGYPNVWLGVSVENARHTWRADLLRGVPAALRFISAEPLLGSLYDSRPLRRSVPAGLTAPDDATEGSADPRGRAPLDLTGIGWIIVGGESGPSREARPLHPAWAREIRDACIYARCNRCHRQMTLKRHSGACECGGLIENDPERPALHMKQWGSWAPVRRTDPSAGRDLWLFPDAHTETLDPGERSFDRGPDGEYLHYDGSGAVLVRYAGPKPTSGGKLLDGVDWCEIPDRLTLA